MSEQARLDHHAALNPASPSPSEAAHADREARLAHDEAQLLLPTSEQPHGREMLSYHEGRPTVREQMATHTPPPKIPDVGGHG
jgi:hypothetical protein